MPSAAKPRVRRLDRVDAEIRPRALGLPRRRPVLALAATTAPLTDRLPVRLLPILRELVAVAAERDAVIVTGGTDAGVIHLLGLACAAPGRDRPVLVGVAPADAVAVDGPDATGDRVALEPNHDVVVLVPGAAWGDETPALSRIVHAVGSPKPQVAVLIGGGAGTRAELVEHLRNERPIVVLAGSGRLADEVAAGAVGDGDDDLAALLAAGRTIVVNVDDGPAAVAAAVRSELGNGRRRLRAAIPPLLVWPRLRLPKPAPAAIVGPGTAAEYPLLAEAISEAEQVIIPVFRQCDTAALREQNRHRLFTVLALLGGLATMVAGALQTWLSSSPWPGVVLAALGAATSALTAVARRQGSLDLYLDARLRAELLRSLYFEHIGRPPPSDDLEQHERLRALRTAVAQRRYEPVQR